MNFFIDPNYHSLPVNVLKRSNGHVAVEFEPIISGKFFENHVFFFFKSFIEIISLGPHTISVLFNRIPIPETPLRVFVELKEIKKVSDEFIEERKYQTDQPTHTHTHPC